MCGDKFIKRTLEYTLLPEDMVQIEGYRRTKGDKHDPNYFDFGNSWILFTCHLVDCSNSIAPIQTYIENLCRYIELPLKYYQNGIKYRGYYSRNSDYF